MWLWGWSYKRGSTVYANVITTQSLFCRRQAQISGPCDHHFSDSHQNRLAFTPKACFLQKNMRSIKFLKFREILWHFRETWRSCSISGDSRKFRETWQVCTFADLIPVWGRSSWLLFSCFPLLCELSIRIKLGLLEVSSLPPSSLLFPLQHSWRLFSLQGHTKKGVSGWHWHVVIVLTIASPLILPWFHRSIFVSAVCILCCSARQSLPY